MATARLHQWHVGLSRSSSALAALYLLLSYSVSGRAIVLIPASAPQAACSQFALSVLHVGLESVEFVCGMSSVSVMQDRPLKGSPSVASLRLPIAIPLLTALRRFANPFRVASFGRADLTKFPWISPVTCEGDTTMRLASCKRIYFLSDFTIRAAHNTVRANASHTVRLITSSFQLLLSIDLMTMFQSLHHPRRESCE